MAPLHSEKGHKTSCLLFHTNPIPRTDHRRHLWEASSRASRLFVDHIIAHTHEFVKWVLEIL